MHKDIAVYRHALCHLELKQVLDCPWDAGVGRIAHAPGERLVEVVMLDEDVRRDDARDVDVGATEHDILA
jgi:hypothetical protein